MFFSSCQFWGNNLPEPEEGWESLDAVLLGELLLLGGINFTEWDWWVVLGQFEGGARVLWGKLLAMSAIKVKKLDSINLDVSTH